MIRGDLRTAPLVSQCVCPAIEEGSVHVGGIGNSDYCSFYSQKMVLDYCDLSLIYDFQNFFSLLIK